jgi:hypothetical protein
MREEFDRRIGDGVEVIIAAGQRRLDVARIEALQEIEHALSIDVLDHVSSAGVEPDSLSFRIVKGIAQGSSSNIAARLRQIITERVAMPLHLRSCVPICG